MQPIMHYAIFIIKNLWDFTQSEIQQLYKKIR